MALHAYVVLPLIWSQMKVHPSQPATSARFRLVWIAEECRIDNVIKMVL